MFMAWAGRGRWAAVAAAAALLVTDVAWGGGGERQFSYRGRKTMEVRMVGSVPQGTLQDGVEVEVAGVMVQGRDLSYNFGIASDDKPLGVVVENVTAATAIRLVEQFPAEGVSLGEDGRWTWFGRGGVTTMEPRTVPWILEEGDTSFVFRIFVETEGGKRIEIYQPAVFGEAFKKGARERMEKWAEAEGGRGVAGGGGGEESPREKNP